MIRIVAAATCAGWLRGILRPAVVLLFWAGALLSQAAAASTELPSPQASLLTALALGTGIVGRDASAGALQLLLARPLRRDELVLGRMLALTTSCLGIALVADVVSAGLAAGVGVGELPDLRTVALSLVAHAVVATGVGSVVLALSTLLPGNADIGGLLLLLLLTSTLNEAAGLRGWSRLARLAAEARRALVPMLRPERLLDDGARWSQPAAWLATVAVSLWLAVAMLNRRELRYSDEG